MFFLCGSTLIRCPACSSNGYLFMMASSNGNIFRVTDPLWGESTGHRWIPITKANDAEGSDVFFNLRLNTRLSKQSRCRWFETQLRSLWRLCNLPVLLLVLNGCVLNIYIVYVDFIQFWRLVTIIWCRCYFKCNDFRCYWKHTHCNDVIMSAMASQITSVSTVCATICSGADQRKYQSSASLTFVRGIHRWILCTNRQ